MKRLVLLTVLAMGMAGCLKEYIEQPVYPEAVVGDIIISVKSAIIDDATIFAEVGSSVVFQAESNLTLKSYAWVIAGQSLTGNPVTYKFTKAGAFDLSLVAVDNVGVSHSATAKIQAVDDISSTDPVKFFSSKQVDGTGVYTYTFFCKKRLNWVGKAPYFIQGDQTNWKKEYVLPADTNYHYRDNQFVVAAAGEFGQWIKVTFNFQSNGSCRFGLGKERSSGDPWSDYSGSKFADPSNGSVLQFLAISGTPYPIVPVDVPGQIGDTIVSLKIEADSIRMFVNNGRALDGKSFVQFFKEDGGKMGGLVKQKSVSSFPRWGSVAISKTSTNIDVNGYVRLKAGLDFNQPDAFMSLSKTVFFNSNEGLVKFKVVEVSLGN
jgi:hypothetical protein